MSVNEVLRKDLCVEAAAGKANPVSHETRQKVVEFALQNTVISCLVVTTCTDVRLRQYASFLHVDTSEPGGAIADDMKFRTVGAASSSYPIQVDVVWRHTHDGIMA